MIAFDLTSTLAALLISFAAQTVFVAILLWCAMKILKKKEPTIALIAAAAISSLTGFVPIVGPPLSFVVLILSISWLTKVSKLGSILVVALAWAIGFAATVGLLKLLDLLSIEL